MLPWSIYLLCWIHNLLKHHSCSKLTQSLLFCNIGNIWLAYVTLHLLCCWCQLNNALSLQALWQLLWVIPSSSTLKVAPNPSGLKKLSVENVKTRARVGLSELLTQVGTLVWIPLLFPFLGLFELSFFLQVVFFGSTLNHTSYVESWQNDNDTVVSILFLFQTGLS